MTLPVQAKRIGKAYLSFLHPVSTMRWLATVLTGGTLDFTSHLVALATRGSLAGRSHECFLGDSGRGPLVKSQRDSRCGPYCFCEEFGDNL